MKLGDVLDTDDPIGALWPPMVQAAFPSNAYDEEIDRLSPPARVIYLVQCFDGELFNGGLSQFFSNSAGNHSHETVAALQGVGAATAASILERAFSAFPMSHVPQDRQARCEILFRYESTDPRFLESLTQDYYRLCDSLKPTAVEDLGELLVNYIRTHASAPLVV